MNNNTRLQLSFMMFLQYFIWGAWYVTVGTYMVENLKSSGSEASYAYTALAIATMISPFLVGMVADRYFSAQKIMGVLHIVGAIALYAMTLTTNIYLFIGVVLFYSLLYMPTIALSNSVAFHQMSDPGKEFPLVRMFGTVGWIVAGLLIGYMVIEKTTNTFYIAGGASLLLGLFSFMLPNVPPKAKEDVSASQVLGVEALVLFKNKSYLVFFISAVLICIPLSFYYGFTNLYLHEAGMENAAGKMIYGQASEAIFILAIPFLLRRIGVKKMLLVGMAAWVLRYILFAYGDSESNLWMLYTGIILHGVCYDFFFVTGYMYTENRAGEKIKSAAQGLFTFATYGLGMVIGTWFSGIVADYYVVNGVREWQNIWMVPVYIAAAVIIYFALAFHDKKPV
ncbi:MFS transporter [Chitinophaga sp. SYP-B3965]|uniref:nucleoside permease n=1 Tax=Chitinophaga sp. SYP-B3965 TaxID=2663120 RepID=UPI0013BC7036|nr:MFS transporter [Chitinophaga sp. SYP-B3965]